MLDCRREIYGFFIAVSLLGCSGVAQSSPLPKSAPALHKYVNVVTLDQGKEWRFNPLIIDVNKDGHSDLVAADRLQKPSLHVWLGDGKGTFSPMKPTWTDIGYGALATGDINGDGFPDIVVASHFGNVQTLLSNGKGGFLVVTDANQLLAPYELSDCPVCDLGTVGWGYTEIIDRLIH